MNMLIPVLLSLTVITSPVHAPVVIEPVAAIQSIGDWFSCERNPQRPWCR